MEYAVAAETDIGISRKSNQDAVCIKVARTEKGTVVLALVCDGIPCQVRPRKLYAFYIVPLGEGPTFPLGHFSNTERQQRGQPFLVQRQHDSEYLRNKAVRCRPIPYDINI